MPPLGAWDVAGGGWFLEHGDLQYSGVAGEKDPNFQWKLVASLRSKIYWIVVYRNFARKMCADSVCIHGVYEEICLALKGLVGAQITNASSTALPNWWLARSVRDVQGRADEDNPPISVPCQRWVTFETDTQFCGKSTRTISNVVSERIPISRFWRPRSVPGQGLH